MRRPIAYSGSIVAAVALLFGSGSVAADPVTARGDAASSVGGFAGRPVPIRPLANDGPATPRSGEAESPRPAFRPSDPAHVEVPASIAAPTDASGSLRKTERIGAPLDSGARPLTRPVVVLYGDSLAWEARDAFKGAFVDRPGVQVVARTFGGTAICDWLDQMADDVATLKPGLVVIEFIGNSFTPCMSDGAGGFLTGAALVERYSADLETVIATFSAIGAQVVLAGAPVSSAEADSAAPGGGGLNAIYRQTASAHAGVRYADAGADVLADGRWTSTLRCLAMEPCTGGADGAGVGINVVRAPDGVHFCPSGADAPRGVTGDCPVWSSGAFRYGNALARPAIESLDAA
jgi:hypothetical protein